VCALFGKVCSLSVALEPLAIQHKELEGPFCNYPIPFEEI
jgi:hypothetical protein